MADVSPTKWHRAHVTWFFETFVLAEHEPGFAPFQDQYWFLFNSYYEAVGPRYSRDCLISRPRREIAPVASAATPIAMSLRSGAGNARTAPRNWKCGLRRAPWTGGGCYWVSR